MQCVKRTHNVLFQILNKKNKSYNNFFVKFFHLVSPPSFQKNKSVSRAFGGSQPQKLGKHSFSSSFKNFKPYIYALKFDIICLI